MKTRQLQNTIQQRIREGMLSQGKPVTDKDVLAITDRITALAQQNTVMQGVRLAH